MNIVGSVGGGTADMDAGAEAQVDARREARIRRAERYWREDLRDQRGWYSKNASSNKQQANRLGLATIALGAAVTFLQVFAGAPWVAYATAGIGVVIAMIEGAQRIWKFDETWRGYRTASEQMKREYRLYVNGAGNYAQFTDEEAAFQAFVVATEEVIAGEVQIYWQSRDKNTTSSGSGTK